MTCLSLTTALLDKVWLRDLHQREVCQGRAQQEKQGGSPYATSP